MQLYYGINGGAIWNDFIQYSHSSKKLVRLLYLMGANSLRLLLLLLLLKN